MNKSEKALKRMAVACLAVMMFTTHLPVPVYAAELPETVAGSVGVSPDEIPEDTITGAGDEIVMETGDNTDGDSNPETDICTRKVPH